MLAIYALKTKSNFLYDEAFKVLHKDIYKNTLTYIKSYIAKDIDTIRQLDNKELKPFAKYLNMTLDNETNSSEVIFHLSGRNDDYDFNTWLLQYLCLKDSEDKRNYIVTHLNDMNKIEDKFIVEYFLKEITRLNIERPHYKETVYLYYGYYKNFEKI